MAKTLALLSNFDFGGIEMRGLSVKTRELIAFACELLAAKSICNRTRLIVFIGARGKAITKLIGDSSDRRAGGSIHLEAVKKPSKAISRDAAESPPVSRSVS